MVTYVTLINWTDQGIKNVKDTIKRAEKFRELVEQGGGSVLGLYWTQGPYDLVAITAATDEESATAVALSLGSAGSVRSLTLRAFNEEEMQRILDKMP